MPPSLLSRLSLLLTASLLFCGLALPAAWLLKEDSEEALAFTRSELEALPDIEALRRSLLASVEDLLAGKAMAPPSRAQALELSQTWAAESKSKGHRSQLILDPQLDIFHLAYLATVKLPERLASQAGLASLEHQAQAPSPRAAYLQRLLMDQLAEERRALELALGQQEDPEAKALRSQDQHRRQLYGAYAPGARLRLRDAAREDGRFWELCLQSLERRLRIREAGQLAKARRRQALAFGLPALALLLGWLLARRLAAARSQEALERGSRSYQVLYEAIPQAAFVWDLATRRFVNVNPAAERLIGLPASQLMGMSIPDLIPPEEREAFTAKLKARDLRQPIREFQRILTGSGAQRWVEVSACYIELEGKPLRLVMLNDVTEARATQEALARSEARFRALVEDASEVLVLMSPDGRVQYCSESVLKVAGYTPAERMGQHSGGILHPDDQPEVWKAFNACRDDADPSRAYRFEARLRCKDGRYIHTAAKLRNLLSDPHVGALVLNYRDVSAEKSARDALRQGEAYFRALIEYSPDVILIHRSDGTVHYENPATLKALMGYTAEERVDKGQFDLVHPDDLRAAIQCSAETLRTPRGHGQVELRVRCKDGNYRLFDTRTLNLSDNPAVGGLLATLRDITASREAHKQVLRLERLAAIGQTAAGLAHEVRNPLAVIAAAAQLLKLQPASQAMTADLDVILSQVDRLKALVQDVLERSRSEELKPKDLDTGELLNAALQAAQLRYGSASSAVTAVLDLPQPAPRLKADPAQLERVLINLVLNGLQAMPGGGSLALSARQEGDEVLLQVADQGPGIPEDQLGRIFEPFYTTKETGSGLGLWICRSIVEQHGGKLEAANRQPRGAVFTVRLKAAA